MPDRVLRLADRIVHEVGIRQLQREGVTLAEQVRLHGRPVVSVADGSRIVVGEGTVLTSWSSRTALGVNHPVVLRTLRRGAIIDIGRSVGISGGSICAALEVTIGDGTLLGANVTIADTDFHPVRHADRRHAPMPEPRPDDGVRIGRNVFIGTGAVVLKGSRVGDDSVIGAGAVVSGVVPASAVFAGNPAREIRPSGTA